MSPDLPPPTAQATRLTAALTVACLWLIAGPAPAQDGATPPPAPPAEGKNPSKPDNKDGEKPGKRPTHAPEGKEDPFRDLSPDDRNRLREAVRRAWNDPAVIQARDEVKAATDAYQTALREALVRTDPEIAGLVEKFRLATQSESRGYLAPGLPNGRGTPGQMPPNFPGLPGMGPGNGNGGGNRDGRPGLEGLLLMENPPFLRDLDDARKSRYREAHRRALEHPEVRQRLDSLKSLRLEDDENRKKRTETIRGLHLALHRALVEADPSVAEFLPKTFDERRPNPGPGEPGSDRRDRREDPATPKPGSPAPPPPGEPVPPAPPAK